MVEQEFITRRDQLERTGTPLIKFWGRFKEMDRKPDSYGNMKVHLHFEDLEVVEASPPYNFPVCELIINYSTRARSAWGLLMDSMEVLHKGAAGGEPVFDINELKGIMVLMEIEADHEYSPAREETAERPAQERFAGVVWRFADKRSGDSSNVAGMSDADKQAHFIVMANGKDSGEFSQAALQDAVGRTMSDEIMNGSLIASLIAGGHLEEVDGKYKATGK